jgi:putative oxidoreductase
MKDVALLVLRAVQGGIIAGHGAQKLFGWFGGNGLKGTAGWLESMGMKPGKPWAVLAGATEFGGGIMTALGALNPIGPLATIGPMGMATAKVHWGKPIWVTEGGAELTITNMAIALALGLTGPGKLSLDSALGLRLPRRLILVPGLIAAAASIGAGVIMSNRQQPQPQAKSQAKEPGEKQPEAVSVPEIPAPSDGAFEEGWTAELERVAATEQSADQPA